MPYVEQDDGFKEMEELLAQAATYIESGGDLNAAFCILADLYMESKGLRYQNMSDVFGAFEGGKAEFVRRVYTPYEIRKLADNGDVFHFCAGELENE